jgi:hypothetical protein
VDLQGLLPPSRMDLLLHPVGKDGNRPVLFPVRKDGNRPVLFPVRKDGNRPVLFPVRKDGKRSVLFPIRSPCGAPVDHRACRSLLTGWSRSCFGGGPVLLPGTRRARRCPIGIAGGLF